MNNNIPQFRDGARAPLRWKASLWKGDVQYDCVVLNLSLGGAKIQVDLPIERGTVIKLDVPELCTLEGEACWHDFGCLGIKFAAPENVRSQLGEKVKALGLDKSR